VHDGEDAFGLLLRSRPLLTNTQRQLIADRLVHQGRCNRGIHATRQRAYHAATADLRSDALGRLGDERACSPRRVAVAYAV